MIKSSKKYIVSIFLSIAMLLQSLPVDYLVIAQDTTPEPTVEPTVESTVEPTVEPTESSIPDLVVENLEVETTNEIVENSEDDQEIESLNEPTEIITGDSAVLSEVENNLNTNVINSVLINKTINIFVDDLQNIDISKLSENVTTDVISSDDPSNEVNFVAVSTESFARVTNNISNLSSTGSNQIYDDSKASITTGNAYSTVTVFNNINTNIVNSKFYIITINVFTDFDGNIILPEVDDNGATNNSCCSGDISLTGTAEIKNNITSESNTGNNTIVATEAASIKTGNSAAIINIYDLVNTNLIGVTFKSLVITTFGEWLGDFLGWGDIGLIVEDDINISQVNENKNINLENVCVNCSSSLLSTNNAVVENNIYSNSNTGDNLIKSESGEIITGNSYSSVSVFNFVNSNIYNSSGFVGFVNIFGRLLGNIGGVESFVVEEDETFSQETAEKENKDGFDESIQDVREEGGKIELIGNHNVGEYVFPGDTITFQAKVKNIGTGKLYDTSLVIEILKDGLVSGGARFILDEIQSGKTKTLTTGLTLSQLANAGEYQTRIKVEAYIGPDNERVESQVDGNFIIRNKFLGGVAKNVNAEDIYNLNSVSQEVLGDSDSKFKLSFEQKLAIVFFGLLALLIYFRRASLKARINAIMIRWRN